MTGTRRRAKGMICRSSAIQPSRFLLARLSNPSEGEPPQRFWGRLFARAVVFGLLAEMERRELLIVRAIPSGINRAIPTQRVGGAGRRRGADGQSGDGLTKTHGDLLRAPGSLPTTRPFRPGGISSAQFLTNVCS